MDKHLPVKKGVYLMLHISLLFSSLSGVCSKKASGYIENIFSIPFLFWFGLVFVIMFGYAVIWQQILRHLPLTVAYANKPVTLVWGIVWGSLIFGEKITWNMLVGAAIIFAGIYLVSSDDSGNKKGEKVL
ncbi:MAG: transporter [Eubacteriales bacterium]|nr:transporter [Eubacteriales bacterium]